MKLTENTSLQISIGAITITLLSALVGGHLTASYVLFRTDTFTMDIFMKIVLVLVLLNLVYFLICFCCVLTSMPNKSIILKASLFMFINIPLAMGYLFIVIGIIG